MPNRPTLRLVVNHRVAPSAPAQDASQAALQRYLQGACTEEECRLCRTPVWARKPGQYHSGIAAYPAPSQD